MIPVARKVWQLIGGLDAGGSCLPTDHAPGVGLRQRLATKHGSLAALGGAKQPAFALLVDAGRCDIGVQLFCQGIVAGDDVLLAAFLDTLNGIDELM